MTGVATMPETSVIRWCTNSAGREDVQHLHQTREGGGEKRRGCETRGKREQGAYEEARKKD